MATRNESGTSFTRALEMEESNRSSQDTSTAEEPLVITTVTDAIDYMGMESTVHCPLQAPPRAVGFGRFQWLLMAYTGFAWIADAMEIMLLSYLAPAAQCAFDLTSGQVSFLSSIVFIGVAIGAWVWSPVADFYGRKRGFAITGLGTAVFSIATALAPSYWVLLAFRFCVGVGLGGVPIIFSLFAEFVPTKRRGVALVAIQGFWTIGTVGGTLLIAATLPTLGWRWMVGLSAIPMCLVMIAYPWLPESPQWMLRVKGDVDGAERMLQRISRMNRKPLPALSISKYGDVDDDKEEGTADLEVERKGSMGEKVLKNLRVLSGLFRTPLLWITLCCLVIWFANAVVYYGLVLLTTKLSTTEGGTSALQCEDGAPVIGWSSYTEVLIVSAAELPGLLVAALVVERLGRKAPMYIGLGFCGIALFLLLIPQPSGTQLALLWISRACIFGTFALAWLFTPEAYPTEVRASGTGLCNGFARVGGIVAPLLSNSLVDAGLLWCTKLIFASLATLAALAALLVPVETKGRKLY